MSLIYKILCEKNLDYFSHSSKEEKIDVKRRKIIEFVIRLCSDVFLEVFRCGDRRKLADLEKIGRRFHWQIDGYFREAPFLCLDLDVTPWYFFLLKFCKFRKLGLVN